MLGKQWLGCTWLSKVGIILSEEHPAECFCCNFELLVLDLATTNRVISVFRMKEQGGALTKLTKLTSRNKYRIVKHSESFTSLESSMTKLHETLADIVEKLNNIEANEAGLQKQLNLVEKKIQKKLDNTEGVVGQFHQAGRTDTKRMPIREVTI